MGMTNAVSGPEDVALIVGGGPGISTSCARHFAANGFKVAIAARSPDKPVLQTLRETLGVALFACDASDPTAVARLFDDGTRQIGRPTLVVHNIDGRVAGVFRKTVTELDPEMVRDTVTNAAFSAFLVGQQAARVMTQNPPDANDVRGTFIITNASAALKGFPAWPKAWRAN